jgi:hypothetical protein
MILLAIHMMKEHSLFELFDQKKFANFIESIYNGYRRDVSYHNDLHAADVAQHCNLILTKGGL